MLLLIVTVGIDWPGVAERPDRVIFPIALVIAVTILAAAVGASDREHRHGAVVDQLTGLLNRAASRSASPSSSSRPARAGTTGPSA